MKIWVSVCKILAGRMKQISKALHEKYFSSVPETLLFGISCTSIFVFIYMCFFWKAPSSSHDESIGRKMTIFFFSLLEGELDLQTALKDSFEHCAITKQEEELVCGHRPFEMKWRAMRSPLFVGPFLIWARDRLVRVKLCACAHRLLLSDVQTYIHMLYCSPWKWQKSMSLSDRSWFFVQEVTSCLDLAMVKRNTLP